MTRQRKRRRPRGGATLVCPRCGTPTRVLRTTRVNHAVHRHRRCDSCENDVFTQERAGQPETYHEAVRSV